MPFGEELYTGVGGRTGDTGLKYSSGQDDIRQKFTGYQKDNETGLDFAEARMYENRFGRFTAVDPLLASGKSANPQAFNRYVYVLNNPLIFTEHRKEPNRALRGCFEQLAKGSLMTCYDLGITDFLRTKGESIFHSRKGI